MNVEEAYYRGSKSLDLWVRLVESHTRRMQVENSSYRNSRVLIVSHPRDSGIPLIAGANREWRDEFALLFRSYSTTSPLRSVENKVVKPSR